MLITNPTNELPWRRSHPYQAVLLYVLYLDYDYVRPSVSLRTTMCGIRSTDLENGWHHIADENSGDDLQVVERARWRSFRNRFRRGERKPTPQERLNELVAKKAMG